ncbi:MAG: hypothetical protein ABL949_12840 [Fimbriimonadaceae bacterium]
MPKNRLIYVGILVLSAAVLLWLGAVVLQALKWFFPWAGGVGLLLIVVGVLWEGKKGGKASASLSEGASASVTIPEKDKVN